MVAVSRDAARPKLAAKQPKEDEELVSSLADAAFEGILLTEGVRILKANEAFFDLSGYEPCEVIGRSALEFVAPEYREQVERNILASREEPYEIIGITKEGARVDLEVRSKDFSYRGRFVQVTTVRDISGRKRAEEELRNLSEDLEREVDECTAQLAEGERRLKVLVGNLAAALEDERRRIAYEIHDSLTQLAVAAHQQLQTFAEQHPPGSPVRPGELEPALSLAQRVVREARHFIEDLRPSALDNFGVATALRLIIEDLRDEGWKIAYEENLGGRRLDPRVETGLFGIAREAINNVRKHAGTREIFVKLELRNQELRLEVADWGRGFGPQTTEETGRPGESVGLAAMRERIYQLGGKLKINSEPGNGTSVTAVVNLAAQTEDKVVY